MAGRWWARGSAALQCGLVLAVVVAVWWPFFRSNRVDNGYSDWSWHADILGYELNALRQDRQFPFWVTDPRFEECHAKGFHDLFADPESDTLSIVPPLAAWLGYLTAVKVALLAFLALGVYGCQRLVRTLAGEAALLPTLVTALLALCNGAIAGHVIIGHTDMISTASFPLVLAWLLEAYEGGRAVVDPAWRGWRLRRAALAGALLAVGYYSGNVNFLFQFLMTFAALLPVLIFVEQRKAWRASLGSAAVAVASFCGLAAFKLLPGLADFGGYRANYRLNYAGLGHFFGSFLQPYRVDGPQIGHEWLMYVGWGGAALLAIGLLGLKDRRLRPLLIAVGLVVPFMFIPGGSPLEKLPFLRTQGALTRFRVELLIGLAVASGFQLARLDAWLGRWRRAWLGRGAATALALLLAFDLSRVNVARQEEDACKTTLLAAVGPFDAAPVFHTGPGTHGTVTPSAVQANAFSYAYALDAPGLLVAGDLPASPRPHLALEGDGELTTFADHLAVRVRQPAGGFRLRFSDPLVGWGLVLTILSALGVAVLVGRRRP